MILSHHALLVLVHQPDNFVVDFDVSEVELIEQRYETLGINDVREMVGQANLKPNYSERLLLVIRLQGITVEAQNALLKILEEPPQSTTFLFVAPYDITLLATLESRFQRLQIANESSRGTTEFAEFSAAPPKDRLALIERETKQKNTAWVQAIKTGLIHHLQELSPEVCQYQELEKVSRLLLTRGASNKLLLEHCAMLMVAREK